MPPTDAASPTAAAAPSNDRPVAWGNYSPQATFRHDIPDPTEPVLGMTMEQQRADAAHLRELAADLGANSVEARMLGSIARSTRNEPPSSEQRIAWRKESLKRAHGEYGEQAESMLNDARRFVAADPKRAAMVARNGVGDHPDMVLTLIELARRARRDGRLR